MKHVWITDDHIDREYMLSIGRNKEENDKLIKTSSQNDIWFHLENVSGPHFVLKVGEDNVVSKCVLNKIGQLFRDYKSGLGRHYNVIYTEIKNVQRTSNVGQVVPRRVKKLHI